MFLRLLPSSFHRTPAKEGLPPSQPLTSFVIRGSGGAGPMAIDAGSLGLVGEAEDMEKIREVLLTHAHIDHVATLPMWIEALLSKNRAPVAVHATHETIEVLRAHFFNGVIFPNFEAITEEDGRPLMRFFQVPVAEPFEIAGFEATAFPVDHPVPTHGYVLDDGTSSVVFGADSGPCDSLWEAAHGSPRVRAVIIEASFPDWMAPIAKSAGHLTPATLRSELQKAPADVTIYVTHMKPAYRAEIIAAIGELQDPRVKILEPGVEVEI